MTTTEIRIENCKKNIEKSQKTLERHKKLLQKKLDKCIKGGITNPDTVDKYDRNTVTADQYWDICDYEHIQEDIKNTEKKLEELQDKLKQWEIKKKAEDDRANVPMVPAVEEFLKRWKEQAKEYYHTQVELLKTWKEEYRVYYKKQIEELCKIYSEYEVRNSYGHGNSQIEQEKKKRNIHSSYQREFINSTFTQDVIRLSILDDKELEVAINRELDLEVKNKRIDLYERCSAEVGVITDASDLKISNNGTINGIVKGEDGRAYVETILAGGYNIQCLHYRVLVKPVKNDTTDENTKISSNLTKSSLDNKSYNFKGRTIEELKEMASNLGAECKVYSDERIYRMRLIMAIKEKLGA